MAKLLVCTACTQQFEVPAEHESAPALQCPFCATVVDNTPENQLVVGEEAAADSEPEVDESPTMVSSREELLAQAEGAPEPESQQAPPQSEAAPAEAEPEEDQPKPALGGGRRSSPFPFAGQGGQREKAAQAPAATTGDAAQRAAAEPQAAQPAPAQQQAPAQQHPQQPARQRQPETPALSGEAPLQTDADTGDGNLMEAMAKRLAEEQDADQGVIVDGLPSEQKVGGVTTSTTPEEEELTPEHDPHLPGYGGAQYPGAQPHGAAPAAGAEYEEEDEYEDESYDEISYDDSYDTSYDDVVTELPGGTRLPGRGRYYFLIFAVVLMVGGYILIALAATANNGIFHLGRLGDTFSPLLSGGEPMELAEPKKERPSTPDFEPTPTTQNEEPRFSTALARPVGARIGGPDSDGPLVLVLFGTITNLDNRAYDSVILDGVIKSASTGGELVESPGWSILPSDAFQEGLNSPRAIAEKLSSMSTMGEVMNWAGNLKQRGLQEPVPSRASKPFVILFTSNVPAELGGDLLYEVRADEAPTDAP